MADDYLAHVHVHVQVTSTESNYYLVYACAKAPRKMIFLAYSSPVHYDALGLAELPEERGG